MKARLAKSSGKRSGDVLSELPARMASVAGNLCGPESERPITIAEIADAMGEKVALNIDAYWHAAARAPVGPIDVIDVFSGCGGMSAGFRAVNGLMPLFNLVAAIDIDPIANATYERNVGITPLNIDVSRLADNPQLLKRTIERCGRRSGNPLVLIGCAPCQGFSSHRNQLGRRDPRNSLFVDFAKIARTLKPQAIIIENVPEVLTTRYWSFVKASKAVLMDAGYSIYVGIHNMAEFGVPQARFRAIMLALSQPFEPPRGFLRKAEFRTVRESIARLPRINAGERHPKDPMHYSAGHKASTLATIRAVPKDGGKRPPHVGPECLRRGEERQGKPMYEDVYGRLYWNRPAITITAYARNPASGRFVHPEQDRGLTVREAALLQAFPSNYWFSGGLDERFRQIGNAVPPAFASYLACHIAGQMLASKSDHRTVVERGILQPVGNSFSRMIPGLKAGHGDQALLMP